MSSALTVNIYKNGVLQGHIEENVIENNIKELKKSLKSIQKTVNISLTALVEEIPPMDADG